MCYGNWRVVTETAPLKTTQKLRKGVTETGFGALQKRRRSRGVTETTFLSEKLQPRDPGDKLGFAGLGFGAVGFRGFIGSGEKGFRVQGLGSRV